MTKYLEAVVDKFVFRVADDRLYTPEGVWAIAQTSGDGQPIRVGVSDYLQQQNGDIAFVHVKPVGSHIQAGGELAEVETIKANITVWAPVSGQIAEVNKRLALNPEEINQAPYEIGWIADLKATNWEQERKALLDPHAYLATMRSQAEAELGK